MEADAQIGVSGTVGAQLATRPIKVLHLRDAPWLDGPARTILETGVQLTHSAIEYHIGALVRQAGMPHSFVDQARARNLRVQEFVDGSRMPAKVIDQIARFIQSEQIDILHCSELRSNVFGLLCKWRRPNLKIVTTVHGWIANDVKGQAFRFADKLLLRFFDRVIFVANAARNRVPEWWLPSGRSCVVHNALPASERDLWRSASEDRTASAGTRVVLLNVGRLSPEKGQDILIRTMAALVPSFPELLLRIAGSGPEEYKLRELANRLGVADKVEFLGYVSHMRAEYLSAALVVQSSLTEGLPNVVLEAAALGIPLLATDVGGTSEVVEHGRSGWLVRSGSSDELEAGIQHFLKDQASFVTMAKHAQRSVCERFSMERRTRLICDIYKQAVSC